MCSGLIPYGYYGAYFIVEKKSPQTIHTEIKRGTVLRCVGKRRFKMVYSADYAEQVL